MGAHVSARHPAQRHDPVSREACPVPQIGAWIPALYRGTGQAYTGVTAECPHNLALLQRYICAIEKHPGPRQRRLHSAAR